MTTPPSPASPPGASADRRHPRRWRRWLKRILWSGIGLLLILVIFHRPILRFAVQRGLPSLAKSGGMELTWEVDGSVTGDVELTNVRVTGDSSAPLQKLTAKRLRADYGLWRLLRGGPLTSVDEVVLEDVDLVLDTTKFPAASTGESPPPPEIILPGLNLTNVNARIILPDGEVTVRGLHLTLVRGSTGVLEFEELTLPGRLPDFKNAKGITEANATKLTLRSLQLRQDLRVEELVADLSALHQRRLGVVATVTVPGGTYTKSLTAGADARPVPSGSGTVKVDGELTDLGRSAELKARVEGTNLTPESVTLWAPLPPEMRWQVRTLSLDVRGHPGRPREFEVGLYMEGSQFDFANVRVDTFKLSAGLIEGTFNIGKFDAETDGSRTTMTAIAKLPERWGEIVRAKTNAWAELDLKDWLAFVPSLKIPGTGGPLAGNVSVEFSDAALRTADARVRGTSWQVQGVPVESLELTGGSDGKQWQVHKLTAHLDAQNTVEASGTLGFDAAQTVQAEWSVDLPNLERLAKLSGDVPGPEGGWLKGAGQASGSLTDWLGGDFSKTTAETKLDASNIVWKKGKLESLAVEVATEAGRATLRKFTAVMNGKNKLTASGGASMATPFDFSGKVNGDFSELQDFNGWMESLGLAKLTGGKATMLWEGSGRMEDFALTGGGMVQVEGFKVEGMKEPATLNLKTSHSGKRADISVLEASMGDLKVSAPGTVTDKLFEIPAIRITAGKLPPVEGTVRVPLDFTQSNGPAGPVATNGNLDVALHVKDWDLAEAARAAGQKITLKGRVDADLKVTGTLFNPAADLVLNLQKVSSAGIMQKPVPTDATVKIVLSDRKLAANMEVTQKPLQTLRAVASMPLDVQKLLQNPDSFQTTPLEGA